MPGAHGTPFIPGNVGRVRAIGGTRRPMSAGLGLDPVPGREVRWLELRSQNGAATRLVRSARPAVRISQLTPVAVSPAERELSDQAFGLMELRLASAEGRRGLPQAALLGRSGQARRDSAIWRA